MTADTLQAAPPDTATLQAAWDEAQRCFRAMLDAKAYPDPEAPETIAYVRAERRVDDILGELQWEASKAEWDALQAADGGGTFPEGVVEGLPEFNGAFR